MRIKAILYGCIFFPTIALLASCGTLLKPQPTLPKVADKSAAWEQQKKSLNALDNWQFSGRLAMKATDSEPYQSVRMQWQSHASNYRIYLTGPLGRSVGSLEVKPSQAQLTLPNKPVLHSDDPDALLQKGLGIHLPVSSLHNWVLGLPDTRSGMLIRLNDQGLLEDLYQNGWRMHYDHYAAFNAYWLPKKITIQYIGTTQRFILLISQWDVS